LFAIFLVLKILATRFFIKKRARLIDNASGEPPYNKKGQIAAPELGIAVEYDMERLFEAMPTKRYVYVIRRLILEDCEPEELAREMNITTANLYNIKRRATVVYPCLSPQFVAFIA